MKSVEELRKEYLSLRQGGEIAMICGSTCSNCGSQEGIEYHHIVPLILGGTNRYSNIIALCHSCHMAAHYGRDVMHYANRLRENTGGRPPKCTDEEAFKALDLLLSGEIGNRKCKELMHLSGKTWPNQTRQFKKWKEERGIESMRSNLDAISVNASFTITDGHVVGWVKYKGSDEKKPIKYRKTGENNVAYENRNLMGKVLYPEFPSFLNELKAE